MTRPGWLTLALLATGAYACNRLLREYTRRQGIPRAKPEPLQVWENEGGGVPAGDSRMAAQVEPAGPLHVR